MYFFHHFILSKYEILVLDSILNIQYFYCCNFLEKSLEEPV